MTPVWPVTQLYVLADLDLLQDSEIVEAINDPTRDVVLQIEVTDHGWLENLDVREAIGNPHLEVVIQIRDTVGRSGA